MNEKNVKDKQIDALHPERLRHDLKGALNALNYFIVCVKNGEDLKTGDGPQVMARVDESYALIRTAIHDYIKRNLSDEG